MDSSTAPGRMASKGDDRAKAQASATSHMRQAWLLMSQIWWIPSQIWDTLGMSGPEPRLLTSGWDDPDPTWTVSVADDPLLVVAARIAHGVLTDVRARMPPDLSDAAVGRASGMSASSVSRLLAGEQLPTLRQLVGLAWAAGVDLTLHIGDLRALLPVDSPSVAPQTEPGRWETPRFESGMGSAVEQVVRWLTREALSGRTHLCTSAALARTFAVALGTSHFDRRTVFVRDGGPQPQVVVEGPDTIVVVVASVAANVEPEAAREGADRALRALRAAAEAGRRGLALVRIAGPARGVLAAHAPGLEGDAPFELPFDAGHTAGSTIDVVVEVTVRIQSEDEEVFLAEVTKSGAT